ncbi:hypothetical protein MJG53_004556 [Ovis ammon polii x Ovis aries]|uniref:Uncharacterized protein n=2 Tax=Ovis TaxID=9935 RepID=A0AAD4YGM1_OVIAM|nr:hypothetical protein MG293_003092 [Ovis ammon polii]KAI4586769.1 hypothetical protein MJG53_004556 [Ovis ammon polii x Ovis aries]
MQSRDRKELKRKRGNPLAFLTWSPGPRSFSWFRERVAKIQLRRHLLEAPRRCKELAGEGGDGLQVNVRPFAQRKP